MSLFKVSDITGIRYNDNNSVQIIYDGGNKWKTMYVKNKERSTVRDLICHISGRFSPESFSDNPWLSSLEIFYIIMLYNNNEGSVVSVCTRYI